MEDNGAMGSHLAAFLGISILIILAPGPDMALVTRNTLLGERSSGVITAVGVVTGLAVWSIATALGLAALLRASEPAFVTVKLVGAAYLLILGTQALYGALISRRSSTGENGTGVRGAPRRDIAPSKAFRQGLISNLGNPKIAVFFTSFLPQFSTHGADFFTLLLLGLLFCALTLLWFTSYALVVAKVGDFLRRPAIRRAIDGLTGAVLFAFGLRLATEQR